MVLGHAVVLVRHGGSGQNRGGAVPSAGVPGASGASGDADARDGHGENQVFGRGSHLGGGWRGLLAGWLVGWRDWRVLDALERENAIRYS